MPGQKGANAAGKHKDGDGDVYDCFQMFRCLSSLEQKTARLAKVFDQRKAHELADVEVSFEAKGFWGDHWAKSAVQCFLMLETSRSGSTNGVLRGQVWRRSRNCSNWEKHIFLRNLPPQAVAAKHPQHDCAFRSLDPGYLKGVAVVRETLVFAHCIPGIAYTISILLAVAILDQCFASEVPCPQG